MGYYCEPMEVHESQRKSMGAQYRPRSLEKPKCRTQDLTLLVLWTFIPLRRRLGLPVGDPCETHGSPWKPTGDQ